MTPSNLSSADEPYVAIFTIQVKPEHRDHFLQAITRAMADSAKEPGVVSFAFLVDREDPNRFVAYDVYADKAAYEAHLAAPHTLKLVQDLDGCLIGGPQGSFARLLCDEKAVRKAVAQA
jgi:quinol monooxygenase YgiN